MRTDRGKKRFLKISGDKLNGDPVSQFKHAIEQLNEVVQDIKNKHREKNEQFIQIDSGKLKNALMDQAQHFIADIFTHLIKDSQEDLNSFIRLLSDTVE